MSNERFEATAAKYGLTPERLDKASSELNDLLSAYDMKEILAVAELIEDGTPSRSRDKGAGR